MAMARQSFAPAHLLRIFAMPLLRRPGRALLLVLAIALGVALGVAVGSINNSALDSFSGALRTVAGSADAQIAAGRDGFDEALYSQIARRLDVAWASPVVEVDARVAGSDVSLHLVGVDPLRAWRVQAALLPAPKNIERDKSDSDSGSDFGLLAADTIALTPAAAQALHAGIGDRLRFISGSETVELKVIALLPGVGSGQQLAVADIATVQSRFHRLGRLSRLDLIFAADKPGKDAPATIADIAAALPAGVAITANDDLEARAARLSRAYRVNLTLLALMALVTGAFLVFSVQAASIVRRRSELAFLRALGMTRWELLGGLLTEAATLGVLGSLLGLAAGLALASLALHAIGGDLGGGFFRGGTPALIVDPLQLGGQLLLGIAAAIGGAWLPAREAAATSPALALKAGDDERALALLDRQAPGIACLGAGTLALLVPPIAELPLGAYTAIALWLAGTVLLLPWHARILFGSRLFERMATSSGPARRLAIAQLRGAPGLTSIGMAGVLAATAVAAAMAIMVGSFRHSVGQWLDAVLPADLYARTSRGGESGFFDPPMQRALAATEGVASVDFIRQSNLLLRVDLPPVALIARAQKTAPASLVGAQLATDSGSNSGRSAVPLIWASEAMIDLYGWHLGQQVTLPIGGRQAFIVGGFWRDYARSFGAIIIDLDQYRQLTNDLLANDAALHLAAGVNGAKVIERLRRLPAGDVLEVADASEIRAKSLAIFDRTFALTYALEAAAVLIGLAGVAASFGAMAAGRLREFGMLAHLGLTHRDLRRMIGIEAAVTTGLGIGGGMLLACAIALVLIHIVNRQSFHWSMDLHVPWLALTGFALAMQLCAVIAAIGAARRALGARAIRAVRDDW
jgi:putative ABC transport system permease protein